MNQDLIKTIHWQHYLSRPFNLFQTSVWNRWYESELMENLFGLTLTQGLFIEYPKGVIRQYRESSEIHAMLEKIRSIAENDILTSTRFIEKGFEENAKVKDILQKNTQLEYQEALNLCIEVAIYGTIFPYFAGDIFLKKYGENSELTQKAISLRGISYYPEIFSNLLIPAAQRKLNQQGIDESLLQYMTTDELANPNVKEIEERRNKNESGNYLIFFTDTDIRQINYSQDGEDILRTIDPILFQVLKEIKGIIGNKGIVRGKIHKIMDNDISNISFKDGEILLAPSTNPALIPLMKKSAGIITDEGGLLCHAAIISRELHIPCIIGTQIATKILKNGDEVLLDADNGIIKIL